MTKWSAWPYSTQLQQLTKIWDIVGFVETVKPNDPYLWTRSSLLPGSWLDLETINTGPFRLSNMAISIWDAFHTHYALWWSDHNTLCLSASMVSLDTTSYIGIMFPSFLLILFNILRLRGFPTSFTNSLTKNENANYILSTKMLENQQKEY